MFAGYSALSQTVGITNSAHDFKGESWSDGEICKVCHAPHVSDITNKPLWNRQVTQAPFTLYGSNTLQAVVGQPDGVSKLCLSCHDGTIALENHSGVTTGQTFVTGDALLGTDLQGDHPISFVYDVALSTADGGLHNPTSQASGLGGTIDEDLLFNGKLQCASCHDVHNGTGVAKLLVRDNIASALCLTCHNK